MNKKKIDNGLFKIEFFNTKGILIFRLYDDEYKEIIHIDNDLSDLPPIYLDVKYIVDFLNILKDDVVYVDMREKESSLLPIILWGKDNINRCLYIMPGRINR